MCLYPKLIRNKKYLPTKKMGKFSQSEKNVDADFIFGTVQSIENSKKVLFYNKFYQIFWITTYNK